MPWRSTSGRTPRPVSPRPISRSYPCSAPTPNPPCLTTDTIELVHVDPPQLDLGRDSTLCEGSEITISSNVNADEYSWNVGATTPNIITNDPGEFILNVRNRYCTASDTINIEHVAYPDEELMDAKICPSDSTLLNVACKECTYLWNTGDTSASIYARPTNYYSVFVGNKFGCTIQTDAFIDAERNCYESLYVPNAFTPDKDGINDFFKIYYTGLTIHKLWIFDRWGELIFSSEDPEPSWNGFYKGELCKTDLYVWKLEYSDMYNTKKVIFGHVTLLK